MSARDHGSKVSAPYGALAVLAIAGLVSGCSQKNNPIVNDAQSVEQGANGTGNGTSGGSSSSGNGGAGGSITCSATLALNSGTPSPGATSIQANVGDDAVFLVSTNASGIQYHWYGTRDGVSDLNQVETDPKAFGGFFQDTAGGHTYTRYVVIEDSTTKAALCNTQTENGGKPMTVAVAPGPTCLLTLTLNGGQASTGLNPISANVGDNAAFLAQTSAATGIQYHWYGTQDGVSDLDQVETNPSFFNGPFQPTAGGHAYTRYVVIENSTTKAPLCNTQTGNGGKPMTVTIAPAPTCSLTLKVAGNNPSMGNPAIATNIRQVATWTVATNATGYQLHWLGTMDGAPDLNMIQNNPAVFDGPFPDNSGGHIYTRYIQIENAATGAPLCSTETANGGQPMTVNVSAVPACTLAVSTPSINTSGGPVTVTWSMTSIVPGTIAYFNGTKNGAQDANMSFWANVSGTSFSQPLTYDSTFVGDYTRSVTVEDAVGGAPICVTNTVDFDVQ